MQDESTSLDALADLLTDIRGASGGVRGISTRSKAAKANAKDASGKGKGRSNGISDMPMFKATPLQELFLGEEGVATDVELSQRMVWEQLDMRTSKVLDLYKEIVRDGDSSGEEDNDNADAELENGLDEGDSDEELLEGQEDEDEDEDEMMSELDDEEDGSDDSEDFNPDEEGYTPPELAEPYFAPLRDSAEEDEEEEVEGDEVEEQVDDSSESDSESPAHRRKSGKKGSPSSAQPTVKGKSSVDRGFFSISDFNAQTNEAEEQMNRYMRSGKSKSANDISLNGLEDDDEEDEEIDYFAPAAGALGEEDEEEEEEEDDEDEGVRPEDMRYDDFWKPPKLLYGDSPKQVAKGKERQQKMQGHQKQGKANVKAKAKAAPAEEPASDATIPVNPKANANKRRVSFHDAVKVQEYEIQRAKQSPIAALVKKYGHKEALRRLQAGEVDEEDLQDEDGEEVHEDEDGDDLMLSDMLDGDGEGEAEDDEMDEEDEEEDGESATSDESGDQDSRAMRRINHDLFAGDDDEYDGGAGDGTLLKQKNKKSQQSRYEARMAALSEQIAELEAENVAERDWTLRGEAKSRDRPVNSLLEEDLEFDQVAKVVPVVTEESSLTLEEKIKKRILDVSLSWMQCLLCAEATSPSGSIRRCSSSAQVRADGVSSFETARHQGHSVRAVPRRYLCR